MPASIPDLSISVCCRDDFIITFTTSRNESLRIRTNLTPAKLDEHREVLYKGLDRFWKLIGTELSVRDIKMASEAIQHLHAVGRQLNFQLFGASHRQEVEEFLRRACPTWQRSGSDGYRPPLVEIRSRIEHLLPWEFLPLFDTTSPSAIRDIGELTRVAAGFLGFSTIIHRILLRPSQAITNTVLDNRPRLTIRFFHHAGLEGAKKEREFFEGAAWIDLQGPWPEQTPPPNEFVSKLATQLWYASTNSEESEPQSLDQIHHFACHCDTNKVNSVDYSLTLAGKISLLDRIGLGPSRFIKRAAIGALQQEFGGFPQRQSKDAYPLVFLNACGASKLTPNGVTSFPELFLEIGDRGVIGSETSVPDLFAAAFSKKFYLSLIHGYSLGEAIYYARWSLLKRYMNPLGILYVVYANPDLRIRKPLPEATSTSAPE